MFFLGSWLLAWLERVADWTKAIDDKIREDTEFDRDGGYPWNFANWRTFPGVESPERSAE